MRLVFPNDRQIQTVGTNSVHAGEKSWRIEAVRSANVPRD
jgi:hypothetical protein